ncbi:hypothetical protein CERSUDRAFT_82179 [Gelatoporia subvermispora B]|uniref:DNA-(apurinic or apyrimidinic site) endonuclease n=1 Tax=Ceriporiopsis subvermispora (strain B) TaxID=914234 RepID=M2PNF9_CERS8|nr:hypothetical protein CERSUDRAFT_82179 [Gelatoporia subvermispora B]
MPPKIKREASKRAAEDEDAGDKPVKKAKTSATTQREIRHEEGEGQTGLAPNGQPTNKVLPERVEFAPKTPGTVRVAAWNICGLAASQKKGFKQYVEAEDPDVLVLTETKVNDVPADPALKARFPHQCWSISSKKTYSGTAILSKIKPVSVSTELPGHPDSTITKGRIVTLEFENTYVVGTYVVNAGADLKTLEQKNEWNRHFETYIRELDKKKPVIWTGDLNVAPTEKDLANAKRNWNKSAGYTEAETTAFARILNDPDARGGSPSGTPTVDVDPAQPRFVDVWRAKHPDLRHYTYFGYRFNCRAKGIGWRLDTFVLSERIVEKAKVCEIRSAIYGASDHCPVVMEIDGEL